MRKDFSDCVRDLRTNQLVGTGCKIAHVFVLGTLDVSSSIIPGLLNILYFGILASVMLCSPGFNFGVLIVHVILVVSHSIVCVVNSIKHYPLIHLALFLLFILTIPL